MNDLEIILYSILIGLSITLIAFIIEERISR